MILTKDVIDHYIDSKIGAWAESTIKSERARLMSLLGQDLSNAVEVFRYLSKNYAPYTVKTIFIRLGEIRPELKEFIKEKRNLFKNAYKRESIKIGFAEVREKVKKIIDVDVREVAEALLTSGLRANETQHLSGDQVLGKGQKIRPYLGSYSIRPVTYSRLYRGLRQVGLKPHTLRKVFATRLVEAGFKPQDLCHIMGWSSFETARFYLQPKDNNTLKENIRIAVE